MRASWRTYRSAFVSLFLVGALPLLLTNLAALPSLVFSSRALTETFRLLGSIDYRQPYDQAATDLQFARLFTMPTDLRIIVAVATGLVVAVSFIGTAALTSAFLSAQEGRRVTAFEAFADALGHRSAIVLPALLLGLGEAAIQLPLQLNQEALEGVGASAASAQSASGALTFALIVVAVAAFYLGVRWGLAIPAILVERIGLVPALRRSSRLTRGRRLRLGLAIFTVGLLSVVTVTLPGLVAGFAIGFSAGSVGPGLATYLLIALVGGALWAPIGAGIMATAYRIIVEPAPPAAGPAPAEAGAEAWPGPSA